jgi:thiol-disulfide isomerase/thioredoxin
MKKFLSLCLTLCLMSASFSQVQTYQVGDIVDNFTITDTHGETHTLYDITATGKYVFLDFFFRNCGPCQQTSRYFYELYNEYGQNQDHTYMLSLSPIDDNATIGVFESLYNGGFTPCPAAGTEGNAPSVITNFGVGAYPTYAIIGPDNRLAVADIWPVSNMQSFVDEFPQGLIDLLAMGTNDMLSDSGFTLSPTISNGNFNLVLNKDAKADVSIYDLAGKQVYSNSFQTKNINLNVKLTNGIYIVNVKSEGKTSTKKIIIKN